jgi:hypothetical protein
MPNEAKHTPGPWECEPSPLWKTAHIWARNTGGKVSGVVATIHADWAHESQCEEQASNARLIAAAPEMYQALQAVMEEWPHQSPADCYSTGPRTGNLIQDHVACPGCAIKAKIEAAIAKAEGR